MDRSIWPLYVHLVSSRVSCVAEISRWFFMPLPCVSWFWMQKWPPADDFCIALHVRWTYFTTVDRWHCILKMLCLRKVKQLNLNFKNHLKPLKAVHHLLSFNEKSSYETLISPSTAESYTGFERHQSQVNDDRNLLNFTPFHETISF